MSTAGWLAVCVGRGEETSSGGLDNRDWCARRTQVRLVGSPRRKAVVDNVVVEVLQTTAQLSPLPPLLRLLPRAACRACLRLRRLLCRCARAARGPGEPRRAESPRAAPPAPSPAAPAAARPRRRTPSRRRRCWTRRPGRPPAGRLRRRRRRPAPPRSHRRPQPRPAGGRPPRWWSASTTHGTTCPRGGWRTQARARLRPAAGACVRHRPAPAPLRPCPALRPAEAPRSARHPPGCTARGPVLRRGVAVQPPARA